MASDEATFHTDSSSGRGRVWLARITALLEKARLASTALSNRSFDLRNIGRLNLKYVAVDQELRHFSHLDNARNPGEPYHHEGACITCAFLWLAIRDRFAATEAGRSASDFRTKAVVGQQIESINDE